MNLPHMAERYHRTRCYNSGMRVRHRLLAPIVGLLLLAGVAMPGAAQQQVRVKTDGGPHGAFDLPAQLFLPAKTPAPAVAIFHGCGGVGVNNTRMAELLKGWGYAALVVDSFSSRGLRDVCGRNWPTQADAEAHPQLAWGADEAPTGADWAGRLLDAARADLRVDRRIWRGVRNETASITAIAGMR